VGTGSRAGPPWPPPVRPRLPAWLVAFERAEANGRAADLHLLQRPIDQQGWGQSSWVNYWSGRDGDLWATGAGPAAERR